LFKDKKSLEDQYELWELRQLGDWEIFQLAVLPKTARFGPLLASEICRKPLP